MIMGNRQVFWFREIKQKSFTDTAVLDDQIKRINELQSSSSSRTPNLPSSMRVLPGGGLSEIVV